MYAAKIFKMRIEDLNPNDKMNYERQVKILKETNHIFVEKFVEEFNYKE